MNPSLIVEHLDAVSRRRALTLEESLSLERAIRAEMEQATTALARRRQQRRTRQDAWLPEEDSSAIALRAKHWTYDQIARCMSRSADAVAARLRALRLREEASR